MKLFNNTLNKLSRDAFYKKSYSQLVIDLIDDVEELCSLEELEHSHENNLNERLGAKIYLINNIIEVINPKMKEDKYALKLMVEILTKRQKTVNLISKY